MQGNHDQGTEPWTKKNRRNRKKKANRNSKTRFFNASWVEPALSDKTNMKSMMVEN